MIKKCVFCNNNYEVTRGCVIKKSRYCSSLCHDNYWLKIGNKSGKFIGNKIARGKKIKLTQTLSDTQKQFIIGTLLGDSSIVLTRKGSPCLTFQHTEKNLDYVLMKSEILKNFILNEKPSLQKARISKTINGVIVRTNPSYTQKTVTHQDFEEFKNLFYIRKDNKRIKIFDENLCNRITSFSLLFWYMDDASLGINKKGKSPFVNLSTNNFSHEEHFRIQKMFNEKFNLNAKIYSIKNQYRYYIRFNKEDTLKLMLLFQPFRQYIPPSMSYKFTFLNQKSTSTY